MKAARDVRATGVVLGGGVAANTQLRSDLQAACAADGIGAFLPGREMCTDNAAMIAWAGIQRCKKKLINKKNETVKSRWPLDETAPFMKGPGLRLS